uniref:Uncharacterized protein n=1 Tax=Arundo donax TaxID=35708 RepID=A0A0A8YU35_ARUDO
MQAQVLNFPCLIYSVIRTNRMVSKHVIYTLIAPHTPQIST